MGAIRVGVTDVATNGVRVESRPASRIVAGATRRTMAGAVIVDTTRWRAGRASISDIEATRDVQEAGNGGANRPRLTVAAARDITDSPLMAIAVARVAMDGRWLVMVAAGRTRGARSIIAAARIKILAGAASVRNPILVAADARSVMTPE